MSITKNHMQLNVAIALVIISQIMKYGISLTLQKNIVACCEPDEVQSGQGEWRCCFPKQSESNT